MHDEKDHHDTAREKHRTGGERAVLRWRILSVLLRTCRPVLEPEHRSADHVQEEHCKQTDLDNTDDEQTRQKLGILIEHLAAVLFQ